MEIVEQNPLGTAPIAKLLARFAVPSILSMVASTLYNIVDQIFIGRGVGYLGNGATNVILPIIGYNYGAGKGNRARKTYFLAVACSTVVMVAGAAVFQLFPKAIISIFGSESSLYQEFAVKSLKFFLLLIPLKGFQLCTGVFFQGIGKPAQATLVSLSRQVLFLPPALLILPHFLGVEGALWAGPVGNACAFVLALMLGWLELHKAKKRAH